MRVMTDLLKFSVHFGFPAHRQLVVVATKSKQIGGTWMSAQSLHVHPLMKEIDVTKTRPRLSATVLELCWSSPWSMRGQP